MVMKKNRKGFTLVELIIVIAIIGILAAVLIPSISGYITKARRSNDVQLAGAMTNEVQNYCAKYDIDQSKLLGTDIRTILLYREFDLTPRKDEWTFVYNIETKKVEVMDIEEGIVVFANTPANPLDPTHIEDNYFLIGKGTNDIELAVDLMCNLSDIADYDEAVTLVPGDYSAVVTSFNPATTLFIGSGGVFSTAATTTSVTKIVCLELTTHLPNVIGIEYDNFDNVTQTNFPQVLRTSETETELRSYFPNTTVVNLNLVNKIDLKQFGEDIDSGIYQFTMGKYVVDSMLQVFSDELMSVSRDSTGKYMIKRKFTVNYYDETGLCATGSIVYAILENFVLE